MGVGQPHGEFDLDAQFTRPQGLPPGAPVPEETTEITIEVFSLGACDPGVIGDDAIGVS